MESKRLNHTKELVIGIVTAVIATTIGFLGYIALGKEGFNETLKIIKKANLFEEILALGALLNLMAFFLFLKIKRDLRAKGVLNATLFIAVAIALIKFL